MTDSKSMLKLIPTSEYDTRAIAKAALSEIARLPVQNIMLSRTSLAILANGYLGLDAEHDVDGVTIERLEEQLEAAQRLEKSLREHVADIEQERDENGRGWLESQEQLEAAQERLTAYETPGWINSVQKVMEERRRAERAEEQYAAVTRERDELENHRRDNEEFIGRQQDKITELQKQLEAAQKIIQAARDLPEFFQVNGMDNSFVPLLDVYDSNPAGLSDAEVLHRVKKHTHPVD